MVGCFQIESGRCITSSCSLVFFIMFTCLVSCVSGSKAQVHHIIASLSLLCACSGEQLGIGISSGLLWPGLVQGTKRLACEAQHWSWGSQQWPVEANNGPEDHSNGLLRPRLVLRITAMAC